MATKKYPIPTLTRDEMKRALEMAERLGDKARHPSDAAAMDAHKESVKYEPSEEKRRQMMMAYHAAVLARNPAGRAFLRGILSVAEAR